MAAVCFDLCWIGNNNENSTGSFINFFILFTGEAARNKLHEVKSTEILKNENVQKYG